MPTAPAVAILAIPHAVATGIRWLRLRSAVHWPTFRQFGVASAIGGLAGAALQPRLGSPVLTVVLACLLLVAGTTAPDARLATPGWRGLRPFRRSRREPGGNSGSGVARLPAPAASAGGDGHGFGTLGRRCKNPDLPFVRGRYYSCPGPTLGCRISRSYRWHPARRVLAQPDSTQYVPPAPRRPADDFGLRSVHCCCLASACVPLRSV
jgi:hypothetical protein